MLSEIFEQPLYAEEAEGGGQCHQKWGKWETAKSTFWDLGRERNFLFDLHNFWSFLLQILAVINNKTIIIIATEMFLNFEEEKQAFPDSRLWWWVLLFLTFSDKAAPMMFLKTDH